MNILVTGGGGFLGKTIVERLLDEGHNVSILGRSAQPELVALGVTLYQGNMTDPNLVNRATEGKQAVFHVAAKAGIWGKWESYYQPNVIGTRNIINACKQNQVPYLIYTSTPSVVFNKGAFCNENESLPYGHNWLCHYAHTKAIAEKEIIDANAKNLKTIAIRPHLIWGQGDPHIIPRIIEQARAGKLRQIGDGKNRVDITHVENAAECHLLALQALLDGHPGGKAYFVSDEEPVYLWQWISELLQAVNIPPVQKSVSLTNAYFLGGILEGIYKLFKLKGEPPMTRFVALQLGKSHYFKKDAAKQDLGYIPVISNQQGLQGITEEYLTPHEALKTP